MTRPTWLIACLVIIAFAALVNGLKLRGHEEANLAADLRVEIATIKAEIEILQAEWFRLNHPARIQKLAMANLSLTKPKPAQIFPLEDGGYAQALISLELAQTMTAGVAPLDRPYVAFDETFSAIPVKRPVPWDNPDQEQRVDHAR